MNKYLSQLAKERYQQYLKSEHWKQLNDLYITENSYCELCGHDQPYDLILHHLNYQHLWYETRDDFQIVCWRCHVTKCHPDKE